MRQYIVPVRQYIVSVRQYIPYPFAVKLERGARLSLLQLSRYKLMNEGITPHT